MDYVFCRRKRCGHDLSIHTPECQGVHVRGIPNTMDAYDEACKCVGFQQERQPQVIITSGGKPIYKIY